MRRTREASMSSALATSSGVTADRPGWARRMPWSCFKAAINRNYLWK
jgi:hypothetical protein